MRVLEIETLCLQPTGTLSGRCTNSPQDLSDSRDIAKVEQGEFALDTLASACARLGADVDRYSFIANDLHPLLLAGHPAHVSILWPYAMRDSSSSARKASVLVSASHYSKQTI
jgi:hypothetical protein